MRKELTTIWLLFPPQTKEIQLDEKWGFVLTKHEPPESEQEEEPEVQCGQNWDHTAIDAESRLLLSIIPGKRTADNCVKLIEDVKKRTDGRTSLLFTSDEHAPYASAIKNAYSIKNETDSLSSAVATEAVMPSELCYATVSKKRENGRVVKVVRKLVFGISMLLAVMLQGSTASNTINTSFVERNNGTDRMQNSRKARKTYGFSKDWDVHNAVTYFIAFSYNFCWPVRTLRKKDGEGNWQPRTPAMAAGLAKHVWTTEEWISYPVPGG
jgi:hypothetical protein